MDTIYHDDGSYSVEEKNWKTGGWTRCAPMGGRHLYPPADSRRSASTGASSYREATFAGEDELLLQVKDLRVHFPIERGSSPSSTTSARSMV